MAASFAASMPTRISCFVLLCLMSTVVSITDDEFTEELFIKPIPKGYVYSHFQFTTKWNVSVHSADTFQHYHFFPKALGDILSKYSVQELHLSLTQGLWRQKQWGYPIHDAPPGAELWVWFKPSVRKVDETWIELVNAVSGLFCASLNFMDGQNAITPRWSFRPKGLASQGYSLFSQSVRYGTLPREIVCTENLTPWKKLLPCDSKAGLSTLFNAFYFHDADYHSLGLHFRPVCADADCTQDAIELSQGLAVVTNAAVNSQFGTPNWSLKSLFGNRLSSSCPLASTSTIIVETTGNEETDSFNLSPAPSYTQHKRRGQEEHTYEVYDVKALTSKNRALNVQVTYNQPISYQEDDNPPIHAHRFVTGYGLDDGGATCLIHSHLPINQTVIYMEVLPWFTRMLLKSLVVENNGHKVPYRIHFIPGQDRARPYQLELSFNLWPHSVTRVSFSFKRAFLKWTEYPPDANHGFYLSSAIIMAMVPTSMYYTAPLLASSRIDSIFHEANETRFPVRVHTETLLVSLPTPDFSMPYNVICLACTVLAIAFGSIHNLTTRRLVQLDPTKKKGLIAKIKAFLKRDKAKEAVKPDPVEVEQEEADKKSDESPKPEKMDKKSDESPKPEKMDKKSDESPKSEKKKDKKSDESPKSEKKKDKKSQ